MHPQRGLNRMIIIRCLNGSSRIIIRCPKGGMDGWPKGRLEPISIHPLSVGSAPIGVQCRPHHRSPHAVILRLSLEYVNFLTTPLLDVIHPFSAWFSASHFSFHRSKHHLLHQSVILHPTYVTKQIQFSFHDLLYDVLLTRASPIHRQHSPSGPIVGQLEPSANDDNR